MAQARHQASVSQLRDFVGKLGGLQAEHRALQLRKSGGAILFWCCGADDGIQLT